jgi:hypothetical protein
MSSAEAVTVVVSLSAFMLGTALALVWYLGGRIDRLDDRIDRLGERIDRFDQRLTGAVNRLAEDVAMLRATR